MIRFAFRLAVALGKDEQEVLSWDQNRLQMWAAFAELEPIGLDWWIMAQHSTMYANVHRKKGANAFKIEDFLPIPKKKQGFDSMKSMMLAVAAEHNAKLGQDGTGTIENVVARNPSDSQIDSNLESKPSKPTRKIPGRRKRG